MNRTEIKMAMSNVKTATVENLGDAIKTLEKVLRLNHCLNDEWYSTEWHVDDVLSRAKDTGNTITWEQGEQVLENIVSKHDSELGINWDVIDANIDMILKK